MGTYIREEREENGMKQNIYPDWKLAAPNVIVIVICIALPVLPFVLMGNAEQSMTMGDEPNEPNNEIGEVVFEIIDSPTPEPVLVLSVSEPNYTDLSCDINGDVVNVVYDKEAKTLTSDRTPEDTLRLIYYGFRNWSKY